MKYHESQIVVVMQQVCQFANNLYHCHSLCKWYWRRWWRQAFFPTCSGGQAAPHGAGAVGVKWATKTQWFPFSWPFLHVLFFWRCLAMRQALTIPALVAVWHSTNEPLGMIIILTELMRIRVENPNWIIHTLIYLYKWDVALWSASTSCFW